MWTTKIVIPYRETALLSYYAKKYRIAIVGYPLTHVLRKNHVEISGASYLIGESKKIDALISEMRTDNRVLRLEVNNNFVVATIKQHKVNKILFQPEIFHYRPYVVDRDGQYIFEIAAWEKSPLSNIILTYQKYFQVKLVWLKEQNLNTVQAINVFPSLTEKQRSCLQLAIDHKYYDYPRRITLKELAKIAQLSYTTYQFHIQNAEKKVMPFLNSMI